MTTEPEPSKFARLTEAEWAEAKALFELGKMTKSDLAAKFAVNRKSMAEGLNKRGAVYGSQAKRIEDAQIDATKSEAARRLEEVGEMKRKQKQRIELLQGLAIKAITDSVQAKTPIGDKKSDMVVLRSAMAIVAKGREELYQLYDLIRDPDGGDEIPEFIVGEYSQDEIEALNNQRLGISDDALDEAVRKLANPAADPNADPLKGLLDEDD